MGWCHQFGPQITPGCDHPMIAGEKTCTCTACGAVCHGRFRGCAEVWAAGPVQAEPSQHHRPAEWADHGADGAADSAEPIGWPAAATPNGDGPLESDDMAKLVVVLAAEVDALRATLSRVVARLDDETTANPPPGAPGSIVRRGSRPRR